MNEDYCPKCGHHLIEVRMWNPDIFGWDADTNQFITVCTNDNCHGWYCYACDEWHPYKTICGVYEVRCIRDGYENEG